MSALTPFSFESRSIRVLTVDGLPWFVAKDVAEALEYSESSLETIGKLVSHVPKEWVDRKPIPAHVPEEWKGSNPITTPGGIQNMLTLSEPGLYFFVNRSDKPKALPFQKWVAGEVLPAIRETGRYESALSPDPSPASGRGEKPERIKPETVTMTKDEYIDLLKGQIALHELLPRRRVLDDDEKAEILSLHGQGWTPAAIGRQVSRPVGSVESFLRRVRLGQEEA